MPKKPDLLPGTPDMLILKTLARNPLHGYGIALSIKHLSDEVLTVEEGSLYPALQRLSLQGWVKAEWKMTETNRRARFYTLTAAGRKQLGMEHTNVRMIQMRNGFGFAFETLFVCGIRRKLRRQNLDGGGALEPRIPRAVHLAHPARA